MLDVLPGSFCARWKYDRFCTLCWNCPVVLSSPRGRAAFQDQRFFVAVYSRCSVLTRGVDVISALHSRHCNHGAVCLRCSVLTVQCTCSGVVYSRCRVLMVKCVHGAVHSRCRYSSTNSNGKLQKIFTLIIFINYHPDTTVIQHSIFKYS